MTDGTFGFAADEVDFTLSTREARLKWVVVVDASLPVGRAVNAAVCAAAATSPAVSGLLGADACDASGAGHPGLPWAGCSILAADTDRLRSIRNTATAREDVFVADMPAQAQETRVYAEYLEQVAAAEPDGIRYLALSLVGPRNRIDRLVGGLPLL